MGDEYVLNGVKCFCTTGGYAKVFVIFASTDPSKGVKGLTAFLVESERTGLSVGSVEHKLGIRCSNTVELLLKDVRIPASHRLGQEGEGMKIAMKTLDMARPIVASIGVGVAQRALDECIRFSLQKHSDGNRSQARPSSSSWPTWRFRSSRPRNDLSRNLTQRCRLALFQGVGDSESVCNRYGHEGLYRGRNNSSDQGSAFGLCHPETGDAKVGDSTKAPTRFSGW